MMRVAMTQRSFIPCTLLLALVFAFPGCGSKSDAPPTDDAVKPARSQVERGPVRATVDVQPARARLSDELTLTLTIDHEEGVSVEKPSFGEAIGALTIRDIREPLPKIAEGRETNQWILTLEPTEPGKLKIDPIAVKFTDRRPKGDGKTHTIETEAVTVEITTELGNHAPSLADAHPPTGPIALPTPVARWPWAVAALAAFVLAAVAWRWLRRRNQHGPSAVARLLTPEELALLELDRLVESGLAERDITQFYVELTGIVRRYIERTTGIRAPEQTTEEFLREISRRSVAVGGRTMPPSPPAPLPQAGEGRFSPSPPLPRGAGSILDDCSRLRDFLESADLVKFAAHRPRTDDIDESVRRARVFVGTKTNAETESLTPGP